MNTIYALSFRGFNSILIVALAMLLTGGTPTTASAAAPSDIDFSNYADVQIGAPVFLTAHTKFPEGRVAPGPNPAFPSDGVIAIGNKVHVPVLCWQDGDWFNGNYRSNRWFFVHVTIEGSQTFEDGYTGPFMVHSSYVTNQVPVMNCGFDGV